MAVNLAPTFKAGNDGKVLTQISPNGLASSVVIQSDGKIIVGGTVFGINGGTTLDDFVVVRYNPDGSLDSTFDGDGVLRSSTTNKIEFGKAITVQSDGKIIIVGATSGDVVNGILEYKFAINRYNADGTMDSTFNGNGVVSTTINTPTSGVAANDYANAVVVQSDGKILVAGSAGLNNTSTAPRDFAIVRYNSDGSLDTSFDFDGIATTTFSDTSEIRSIKLLADGKILAAGFVNSVGSSDFALVRYNSNGSLDTTFGIGGKVVTNELTPLQYDSARAESILYQSDGKIILIGNASFSFGLARYNSDGSLDSSFGNSGLVTSSFVYDGFEKAVVATSAIIQLDGKVIVAGLRLPRKFSSKSSLIVLMLPKVSFSVSSNN